MTATSQPALRPDEHAGARLPAALWDFDGTLADTEPIWIRAEYALVAELGGRWSDEHAHNLVGNSLIDSGRYIVDVLGRNDLTPEWVVARLVEQVDAELRTGDIPWRPGALELLDSFAESDVPCALVSASYRSTLDAAVSRLRPDAFATVVAGDEVRVGKPDPEPYLEACRRLEVDPRDCVVLEDSIPGTTSGNASGAFVLAIRNHVDLPQADRRHVVDTLVGLTAHEVAALHPGSDR
ncbi:HAD family hydrolase [Mariniluteicoccus flavus]